MGTEWQEKLEPGAGAMDILKALGMALLEPAVIAFLVLTATVGFWLPAVVYCILLTWFLGMGSLFMWVVAGIGAVLFLSGMGHFLGWTVKLIPYAKELKAAKLSRKKAQIDLALDAWRIWSKRRRFWPLFMALLSIYLIIPACVAIALANSAPGGTGTTRDEQMRAVIRKMGTRAFGTRAGGRP
jgi:hypothetical protein